MLKATFITTAILLVATNAQAQDSFANASTASNESAVATAHLSEAGVKVVAGSVAVPVVLVGGSVAVTGSAAVESGLDMSKFADKPLTVSPETMTRKPQPMPAPVVPYEAEPTAQKTTAKN